MYLQHKWALIFALLPPLLLLVAVYPAGGGHGWYGPAVLLFPWPLIGTLFPSAESLTTLMIVLAFVQYPIYGFLIDFTQNTPWFKRTLWGIVSVHLMLMLLLIALGDNLWR